MNADPRVMEHFLAPLSREESDAAAARIARHFDQHGFGLWSVEVPGVVPFAGFVGLACAADSYRDHENAKTRRQHEEDRFVQTGLRVPSCFRDFVVPARSRQ